MRVSVCADRRGRFSRLDHRKLIIIVFLLRVILASAYDIYATLTDKDVLLPDTKFYSIKGRYVALLLDGYDGTSLTTDLVPGDRTSRDIFTEILNSEKGDFPKYKNETNLFSHIVGLGYYFFGYHTIWIRIFNICLSILSAYLLFLVAKKLFGDVTANMFLVVALFFTQSIRIFHYLFKGFDEDVMCVAYNMGDIWEKVKNW